MGNTMEAFSMFNASKKEHSLLLSLSVGGVFQIKREVNDSHLKRIVIRTSSFYIY